MMKYIVILALIAVASALLVEPNHPNAKPIPGLEAQLKAQFEEFKTKHGKQYADETEEAMRFTIFKENVQTIRMMNQKHKKTTYGINKFADLSKSEFARFYLMPKRPIPEIKPEQVMDTTHLANVELPSEYDWRKDGLKGGVSAITPVKNQGQCGSCWAFSATEQLESMSFLQGHAINGKPADLAPQQIVDCDHTAYGCNGGWTYAAYEYVESFGGQDSESSYPYQARDGECRAQKQSREEDIQTWKYITQNADEKLMQQYIASTGPLSICADASSWQFYQGGVITSCGQQIDHCIQLVGYTSVQGTPAWTVRNSWGTGWGNDGYLYVERGQNMCGIGEVVTTVMSKAVSN